MGQTLGVFEPAADAARTPSAPGGFCWTPKALESVSRQFRSNSVSECGVKRVVTIPSAGAQVVRGL